MENSAPLRIFMVEPTEIEKVVYVFAKDTYISPENKQILIPYFARCSFEVPANETYMEYRMQTVEETNKITIFFTDKNIYSYKLKVMRKSFYKDYRATSVAALIDINDFNFYNDANEIEKDLQNIDIIFEPYLVIKKLEEKLTKAIKKEDYLAAAKIRDELLVEKNLKSRQ